MDNIYFKKILTAIILLVLLVLSFLLLKPILLSIIFGIILALIFFPVYNKLYKKTKSRNLSASLICIILVVLILLPVWFLTPIFIDQSFKIYLSAQQMDFVTPLQSVFPSLFASAEFSAEVGATIHSFVTKLANYFVNQLSQIILDFPIIFLQSIVVLFTFFFALRDKDLFISYVESFSPFSKDVEKKLFESSKNITTSMLYGQFVIGIIQGLITGAGFLLFSVPNALVLSLLAIIAGIFPIIGTTVIWVPVVIYLFLAGNNFAAMGVILFGVVASLIDNFLRPAFVSKRTNLNSSLVLVGMIGGLFLFGILGLILGPLILAYLMILLDLYRNKKAPKIFNQN